MIKLLIAAMLITISFTASAQKYSYERDSIANNADFKVKVKMASIKAANNILADTGQPREVQNFAQIIITEPLGGSWLAAMSYGCITNPAINGDSNDSDIEFTVNSLFVKYALAWYKVTK